MRGADLSTYKIAVPAKLFIAGEYAVTRPGGLALVTSLESDFQVVISEAEEKSLLETNVAMPAHIFSVKEFKPERSGPWNFVMTAIEYVSKEVELSREFHLEIKSGLGFGESKKGYGSSACVVVGVVNALNLFFQLNLALRLPLKHIMMCKEADHVVMWLRLCMEAVFSMKIMSEFFL